MKVRKVSKPYQLWQGDCLELMQDIPDQSVDLILADPPYGTTACKWDSIIPLEPMWIELKRIIKPNGAICLFGSEPFSSHLRLSNLKQYKYDWVWNRLKPTGFLNANFRPLTTLETISVFSKVGASGGSANSLSMVYSPQGVIESNKTLKNKPGRKGTSLNASNNNIIESNSEYKQKYTNHPTNYLEIKVESGKRFHPTQKPVALMEYLIKTYSNEGELVLDNCMGSGSTGVAALNLGRRFIGIELDHTYFELAKERIERYES